MVRVVAFLRAINVGGRTVKKEKLKDIFVALGFRDVETFKQSGNVIFESDFANLDEVETRIEKMLLKALGYEVPAFLRTVAYLEDLVRSSPEVKDEKTSLMVTLLPGQAPGPLLPLPLTIPKSKAEIVSASDSEVFSLTHGGGEGGLPNPFLESRLKVKATTRNMNVIREIVRNYGRTP